MKPRSKISKRKPLVERAGPRGPFKV